MVQTYLWGYGSGAWGSSTTRRTKEYILAQPGFANVDPELMRRLFGLADAVIAMGSDYGFGGGWRSSEQQLALFLDRYKKVNGYSPGAMYWDGLPKWPQYAGWYVHIKGASAAPPGKSYHESTTKNATGYALAVDMVGDHAKANKLEAVYGLKDFLTVNSEPWHYQPVEIPNSRSNYNGQFENPQKWLLPGDQLPPPIIGDDMKAIEPVRVYDTRGNLRPDGTPINGAAAGRFKAGEIRRIPVVMGQQAYIHVTTVNAEAPGYISISGDGTFSGGTSLVNTAMGDVRMAGAYAKTPDGHVYVRAHTGCDVIIDTYAEG